MSELLNLSDPAVCSPSLNLNKHSELCVKLSGSGAAARLTPHRNNTGIKNGRGGVKQMNSFFSLQAMVDKARKSQLDRPHGHAAAALA